MAKKSDVYAWRVSPSTKAGLGELARETNRSVAQVLEDLVTAHLQADARSRGEDVERQRRLRAKASRFIGGIAGGRSGRSERVREIVRRRLAARRDR